jgi:ACT domain-containing protein
MNHSVMTVVGKDRIGIVYEVAKLLAENQINILNISQQLLDGIFTMIILLDTEKCTKTPEEFVALFQEESAKLALDIRVQNEALFNAMHRI